MNVLLAIVRSHRPIFALPTTIARLAKNLSLSLSLSLSSNEVDVVELPLHPKNKFYSLQNIV